MKCFICLFGDEVRLYYFIVLHPACSASRCWHVMTVLAKQRSPLALCCLRSRLPSPPSGLLRGRKPGWSQIIIQYSRNNSMIFPIPGGKKIGSHYLPRYTRYRVIAGRVIKGGHCTVSSFPTTLAHQFMRVEREGDWILQQHMYRENAAIFLCSWPSPLCSLHQLASTRYAAHSTLCQAGSPQWSTRLPSHRRSWCGVRGPIRRADVYQTGENKPRDWRAYRPTLNELPSGTSRSVFVLTLQWQWTKKAAKEGN